MLTGELKKLLIDTVTPIVQAHQQRRAAVTEAVVDLFMTPRPLRFCSK
jgi:tryptophanyl-tRNA synthetase